MELSQKKHTTALTTAEVKIKQKSRLADLIFGSVCTVLT
jgi:hypothetical protein